MVDDDKDESGFSEQPAALELSSSSVAFGPKLEATDELDTATKDFFKLRQRVWKVRAIGGAIAFVAGVVIVGVVVGYALCAVSQAWDERVVFGKEGATDRLKYLIAYFTFKATALGAALTSGLMLIRAANQLTGGALVDDVKPPSLHESSKD